MKKYLFLFVALPALVIAMENELTSEEKKVISEKLRNLADNRTTWPEFCTFLKKNEQNVDRYWKTLGSQEQTSLNVLLFKKAQEDICQREITYLESILKDISETTDEK